MIALDSLTERGSNMSRDSKQRPIALFSLTANSIDSNSTKVSIVTAMGCNVPTESFLMHTYDSRKPATRRQATWRFGTYRSEEIFHVFFKCHYIGLRILDMLVNVWNMYRPMTSRPINYLHVRPIARGSIPLHSYRDEIRMRTEWVHRLYVTSCSCANYPRSALKHFTAFISRGWITNSIATERVYPPFPF